MCGIVGYTGPEKPKDVILKGLKALEYRGYDSAGVAILDHGKFKRVRAEGKLSKLVEKLENEEFSGRTGIGHTRWATHGPPNEINAHPHKVGDISLVHNGIIENYQDLREELLQTGAVIESDTDSELVAHLLAREVAKGLALFESVIKVLPRLRGAYSIVVVRDSQPDEMVAFKSGPPLLVGVGDKEAIIASDALAILPYTKKVIYLDDEEIAHVRGASCQVYSRAGKKIDKSIVTIHWTAEQVEKSGYTHYMLKEIFEQPRAVAQAIDPHIDLKTHSVHLSSLGFSAASFQDYEKIDEAKDLAATKSIFSKISKVQIVACGTSFYAGMVGEYLIERLAKLSVEVDIASEFRYREPIVGPDTLFVVISQSGETADTLAALRLAKEKGAKTLSICNVRRSSIDREAHGHLYMNAGSEIGVASTKAFVATLSVLNVLAIEIAKCRGQLSAGEEKQLVTSLQAVPSQMEKVLAYDKFFRQAADILKTYKGFLYMGRGVHYPIAMEGALKLKELAYMHAEGYAAGEMKHGPLALIDEEMAIVMLVPKDETFEKTLSNLEEAKARGGHIIAISTGENTKLRNESVYYLTLPDSSWTTLPILEVVPLQLLAYHVANSLNHDVDQPRNLAKSVTVE